MAIILYNLKQKYYIVFGLNCRLLFIRLHYWSFKILIIFLVFLNKLKFIFFFNKIEWAKIK